MTKSRECHSVFKFIFRSMILAISVVAIIALTAAFLPAHAQTVTNKSPLPSCWPSQVPTGTGSKAVRVTSDYGQAIMWWCGQETEGIVASWAYTMNMPDKFPVSLADALKVMWELNVSADPIDVIPRAQLKQDALIALQPLRPAAEVWKVSPFGNSTSRPVYHMVNNVWTLTSLRAPVGALCDCNVTRTTTVKYCKVPSIVTTAVQVPMSVCAK